MLSVTIETALLAPPISAPTPERVFKYVTDLLGWSAAERAQVRVLRSQRAAEVLVESGRYPYRHVLDLLIRQAGVEQYDAGTVAQYVEKFMRCEEAESFLGISDFLDEGLTIVPDVYRACNPSALRRDCERAVVMAAIARSASEPDHRNHAVASSHCDAGRYVSVRTTLTILEHEREDLQALDRLPADFDGRCPLCASVADYLAQVDAVVSWSGAADNRGLRAAIEAATFKSRQSRRVPLGLPGLPRLRLHPEFFDSANACGALDNLSLGERVLRAAVETIEGLNMPDVHPIRTDRGGGAPQRRRGQDAAWRRDIDDEYHLHYWECGDGTVELACIGPHNNYRIPH